MKPILHIAKDGTGDFRTITEALYAISSEPKTAFTFFIHKGIYKEQLTITTPYLTLIGEDAAQTILTYDLYARMEMPNGEKRGTFRTYSTLIDTHDFTARNLTFKNSSGSGPHIGQAIALYVDGDRIHFSNCRFLGGQDTLFTAPLPPKEIQKNGFIGPKQYSPRVNGRHYYEACYIEGDIDFIFGGATAYFESCELHSNNIGQTINGYVTAPSTPQNQIYGYVMKHCRFTSDCPPHTVFLGRPWRNFAKAVLLHCEIGSHIALEGWDDWDKPSTHDTVYFAEYQNFGSSASMNQRPGWVKTLSDQESLLYTKELVLGGCDGWSGSVAGLS